jgi:copper chaperone NosL
MRRLSGAACLIVSGLIAGCGIADPSRPPNLRFGEEACAQCRMIISDERFAAAVVIETGEVLKFDDIGCLIRHETDNARPVAVYWVRSFGGSGWLNAHTASFVHLTKVRSPMDYGLAALPTAQAAQELADDPAVRPLRWDDLPGFLGNPPREPASDLPKPE